jgi:Raf kinase inhibitor-like YbhB/YbcL family protein
LNYHYDFVYSSDVQQERSKKMEMKLTSNAFVEGGFIPAKYTCDGKNVSPQLAWVSPPTNAKSFALICDDPDAPAGVWVHWVIFNIPATVKELPEEIPPTKTLPDGTKQGMTDFRRIGYGGPCPPSGVHRYFFKLYALDKELTLEAGITKAQLLKAIEGHILASAQMIGKYSRK